MRADRKLHHHDTSSLCISSPRFIFRRLAGNRAGAIGGGRSQGPRAPAVAQDPGGGSGPPAALCQRWDLSDLPAYQPEAKVSGTIKIYGLNYLTDGNLGKYWDEGSGISPDAKLEFYTPTALVAIPASTSAWRTSGRAGASRLTTPWRSSASSATSDGDHDGDGSFNVPGWAPTVGIFVNKRNPLAKISFPQLDGVFGAERLGGFEGTAWSTEFARGPEKNIRTWAGSASPANGRTSRSTSTAGP